MAYIPKWTLEKQKDEFAKKNLLLGNLLEQVSPYTFYEDLYFDLELIVPVVHIGEDIPNRILKMSLDEALDYTKDRSDVLFSTCSYRNNFVKKSLVNEVYGFVVDIDYCSSELLQEILADNWVDKNRKPLPHPTYIVNSGAGIHLYFMLEYASDYRSNKDLIDAVNDRLTIVESNQKDIELDSHWVGQGYRIVGSKNKFNEEILAFSYGEKWDLNELKNILGIDQPDEKETEILEEARRELIMRSSFSPDFDIKKRERWNLPRSIFDNILKRCMSEINEGHRYKSLMALTIMGYKCRVSYTELEDIFDDLVEFYNRKEHTSPLLKREIHAALRLYNSRATTVRSATLEDWLGFKFNHYNRHYKKEERYPREKTASMKEQNLLTNLEARAWSKRDELYPDGSWRKNAGRKTLREKIENWQKEHPKGSRKECCNALNISYKTVSKWWKQ